LITYFRIFNTRIIESDSSASALGISGCLFGLLKSLMYLSGLWLQIEVRFVFVFGYSQIQRINFDGFVPDLAESFFWD
jgi:hypothetical protein